MAPEAARAASLARRATRNIIYLTSLPADIAYTNPHMFDILCGVQSALSEKGYTLTIMDTCREEVPGSTPRADHPAKAGRRHDRTWRSN